MDNSVVTLRKKGGIHKIKRSVNGGNVNPQVFSQRIKDPDSDGEYLEDYRGSIPGTVRGLAPTWDIGKNQWNWNGTVKELEDLVRRMKLKYPEGHHKEGRIIEPGSGEARLQDFYDEVFRHPSFYGTVKMRDSRLAFKRAIPRDEFLLLCYKGNREVDDKAKEGPVNPYSQMDTIYELISPKNETQKKVKDALKEGNVSKFIGSVFGDDNKVRAICEIMGIPRYIDTMDTNAAWLVLKEFGAENHDVNPRSKKSYQDQFIELMQLDDGDLAVHHKVSVAVSKGILRKRTDHYLFNGNSVDRVPAKSNVEAVRWFMLPDNSDELLKLSAILEEK